LTIRVPFVSVIYFYLFDLKGKKSVGMSFSIQKISQDDQDMLEELYKLYPEVLCFKRWSENSELFCLINQNKIPCSYGWININRKHYMGEIDKNIVFKTETVFIYDCITPVTFRGLGYYPSLIRQLSILYSQYSVFIYTLSNNIASQKGIKKAGFVETHRMVRVATRVFLFKNFNSGQKFYIERRSSKLKREIKICLLPVYDNENPYQELMANGLREGGLKVEFGSKNRFFGMLKTYFIQRPDWIHFDWIYSLYSINLPFPIKWIYLYWFLFQLSFLRTFTKCKFGFTLHNLERHENYHSRIDHIAQLKMFSICTFVRIFSDTIKSKIVEKYGNANIQKFQVVPEGSYVGFYPNTVSSEEARIDIGFGKEDFVILFLGTIRPYKGILELVNAFLDIKENNWKLIIAGFSFEGPYVKEIKNKISGNNNIKLFLGHQAEDKLQYYFNSCDVVACPFKKIENSGSVILAMGFKKPVIAPRVGAVANRLSQQDILLYNNKVENSLKELKNISIKELADIGQSNFNEVQKYTWKDFSKLFYKE